MMWIGVLAVSFVSASIGSQVLLHAAAVRRLARLPTAEIICVFRWLTRYVAITAIVVANLASLL